MGERRLTTWIHVEVRIHHHTASWSWLIHLHELLLLLHHEHLRVIELLVLPVLLRNLLELLLVSLDLISGLGLSL